MQEDRCFDVNLALVLAHSMVWESAREYPGCESARNGGDPKAPPATESTASVLQALSQNLPALAQTVQGILPGMNASQLASMQQMSGPQAALQTQLYGQYGPQLNAIGSQIAQQNALAQAQSDAAVLGSPQQKAALQSAMQLSQLSDPQYYATRALAGQKMNDLLSSIDPTKLTGSESAEIERNLNRQNVAGGVSGVPTPTSTISNAMTFGSALNQKKNLLSQALGQATSFLPSARSGVFEGVTGKGQLPNTGESKFMGVNQQAGQQGMDFGNQVLGNVFGMQQQANQINAQRRDTLDRLNQTLSSLPT